MNNTTNTINIDDTNYKSIRVRVYDRVAHRTVKHYSSVGFGGTLSGTWMMWRGLNVDCDRFTKTLLGTPVGSSKEKRICFVG